MRRFLLRLLAPCSLLVAAAAAADFPVTDFGAIADDDQLDTTGIQTAIDHVAQSGGGRVVIPKGTFRSGSLFLKAGVELHLEEGAVLLGSTNIEDYSKRETRIEGHFEPWRMALLNAEKLDGVRITGAGKIDGNGILFWAAFWQRRKENPNCTNLEVERPRLMFIDRCTNVRLAGLVIRDSGFWNVHLYRCRDVVLDGLNIVAPTNGPVRAPSTDGIDVDSCQDVTIRRCHISVGDDCIALKGTKGPLADQDADSPPVENITIEDCTFGDGGGITCGSEATIVRNVTVRRCEFNGRNTVLRLKLRPDTPQHYENIIVEDIKLAGEMRLIDVAPWRQFFDLKGLPPPSRQANTISFRNISGSARTLGRITGNPGDTLRDFRFENVNLAVMDEKFECDATLRLVAENVVINGKPFAP
jgi:alpha-L-rhamnosidase